MITFDGDRSLKRKWFAQKKLDAIKEMDIPGSCIVWDGFRFKVWQLGDIDGGRVTAPMGAVVACSTQDGIKIAVADYWAGGFNAAQDLYTIYYAADGNEPLFKIFDVPSVEDMIADGNQIVKFRPMGHLSPYGLIDGDTEGPDTVWVRDDTCIPGIMPFNGAEGFCISVDDNVFVDLNNNGTADFPKYIIDNTRLFYSSNGSNLGGRQEISMQVGGGDPMAGSVQPWRIVQQLTAIWQVMHQYALYENYEDKFVCVWNMEFPTVTPVLLETVIPIGSMPSELRTLLLDTTSIVPAWPMGYYSFVSDGVQTILHVADVTNTGPWTGSSPTEAYFNANSADEEWKLYYTFTVGGTSYVINSDQFISLLDSLADIAVIGDWHGAKRMLHQLLPYPNNNWGDPYDSVMFHAHDGNIYTWTRKYGAVKFTPTGLFAATVVVPTEVSAENGVRPDITYAGMFDTIPLYLCICNKVKEEVKAVYYGSPFAAWTALPGTDVGQTLVHVRPVSVTLTDTFLIGVVKETITVDGVVTEIYSFASLHWIIDSEGNPSTDLWKKLGRLPFDVTEYDNFQVGLFGEDKQVIDLANYLSPPPVLPQMPVGPYDKYTIGMP